MAVPFFHKKTFPFFTSAYKHEVVVLRVMEKLSFTIELNVACLKYF